MLVVSGAATAASWFIPMKMTTRAQSVGVTCTCKKGDGNG